MKILLVGHVCIDKNKSEGISYTAAGSPAMFMQKIFRDIPGCEVVLSASYGPDFLQYTKGIRMLPSVPNISETMVYENIITHGVRTQRCHNAAKAHPAELDSVLAEVVATSDILCLAPLTPAYSPEFVKRLVSHKKEGALVVLLPQGYFRAVDSQDLVGVREFAEEADILPSVDVVIVSDQDHSRMDRLSESWAGLYGATVVMTRAEKGADIFSKKNRMTVPVDPVPLKDIVNSVGAGDIFSAGFMYEFAMSKDVISAARYGHFLARQSLFFTPDTLHLRTE